MKSMICLLLVMTSLFFGAWTYRVNTPLVTSASNNPDSGKAWWEAESMQEISTALWQLNPEIPDNYIPVIGSDEVYMVIGTDGKIERYRHRVFEQETGEWRWEDINPDIPDNYEPVEGLENVYQVMTEDGTIYLKYIRYEDDTFTFVQVDEYGSPLDLTHDDGIPANYIRVVGNVYAVLDDTGNITGYRERLVDESGAFYWVDSEKPTDMASSAVDSKGNQVSGVQPGYSQSSGSSTPAGNQPQDINVIIQQPQVETKQEVTDSGRIETETYTESKTSGGYTIIFETTITRTYNKEGDLISTKKEGPIEISRYAAITSSTDKAPNPSMIAASLDAEYARVMGSLSNNQGLCDTVLSLLNDIRVQNGLAPVVMNEELSKLAAIKAADMYHYGHTDFDSPMYGTILELADRFDISGYLSETLWRTNGKTSDQIHARFQAQTTSYGARMNSQYTQIGIAVIEQNGYQYITEVYR